MNPFPPTASFSEADVTRVKASIRADLWPFLVIEPDGPSLMSIVGPAETSLARSTPEAVSKDGTDSGRRSPMVMPVLATRRLDVDLSTIRATFAIQGMTIMSAVISNDDSTVYQVLLDDEMAPVVAHDVSSLPASSSRLSEELLRSGYRMANWTETLAGFAEWAHLGQLLGALPH